jgi:hypothetical protein
MTGRLAVAIGLVAALAVVSVAFLRSRAEHSVSAASAESPKTAETIGMRDLPKPVRTVTMRREPATVGDAQASAVTGASARPLTQNVASVAERIDAVAMKPAQPRVENALALTAPLKMWAMFPAEPSAGEQDAATAPAEADDGKAAKDVTPKRAAVRHQRAKAANRARRRRYTRRRRARTAATRPQPAQQAAVPAETQTNADQPVRKLPLQAAIDAIFGNGGDSGDVTSAGTEIGFLDAQVGYSRLAVTRSFGALLRVRADEIQHE